ncbi:hypothetical protein [Hoeflea sp.]|uniref:hypothetical protein n=1 Tax=Hoeflea sp. TaxID=1940281 RepID=UPI003B521271
MKNHPPFDPDFDPFCREATADVIRRWHAGKPLDEIDQEVLSNAMARNAQEQAGLLR